jgi:2'-5' RNA ligase
MYRLFIALEIPEEVISLILEERDKICAGDAVKWESRKKLHITLKFLGGTEESLTKQISVELESLVSQMQPLKLELNKFGVFRKGGEPKILWVGMRENKRLLKFVAEIEKSFCKFGYPKEERKFKPHITLLRFRGNENSNKILNLLDVKLPPFSFNVNTISLVRSELKQTGSVYTTLKSFQIKN